MDILVADDDPMMRKLLKFWLQRWNYNVIMFENGEDAWQHFKDNHKSQVAILDWEMPGLTGPQITKNIRDNLSDHYIYTIVLTNKSNQENIIEALESGSDDYLKKPFDPNELKSRINAGLRVIRYHKSINDQNKVIQSYAHDMEVLASQRAQALIHADRLATLGTMSAGIAHEINNPNSFISGNIQSIEKFWLKTQPIISKFNEQKNDKQLDFILNEMQATIDGVKNGVNRITNIVKSLKTYARDEKSIGGNCDINNCVSNALELCQGSTKQIIISTKLTDKLHQISANHQQIEQVIVNIVTNASHALVNQPKQEINIETKLINQLIQLTIEDNGPGIPENIITDIFNPFFTTKDVGKGTGLGLSISHGIITDHGGKIHVDNKSKLKGARFMITLPLKTMENAA